MKNMPQAFDAFSFLQPGPQYCENKECEEFGYVTVVGIPEATNDIEERDEEEEHLPSRPINNERK